MPAPKTSITSRKAAVLTIPTTSALTIAVTTAAITWTGATTDMVCAFNFVGLPANVSATAAITAANTVTCYFTNPTAGNISVTGATVNVVAL